MQHLGSRLQAYQGQHTEDDHDHSYDQVNNPHDVLLLLKRNGTAGREDPLWQVRQIPN